LIPHLWFPQQNVHSLFPVEMCELSELSELSLLLHRFLVGAGGETNGNPERR
jgi:hypothetical protein